MRAATRLRLPLVIAAGLFTFTCLLSSASAGGSTGDTTYAQVVTASHPVGWWRLGETTGGYADSSGRTPAHPGALRQTPRSTFTRGETDCPPFPDSDGCINMTAPPKWALDGLDQSWIYVPANRYDPTFNFGGRLPYSYEAWINPSQGLNSVNQGILGSYGLDVYQYLTIGTGLYFTSPDDTITFNRRGWAAGGRVDGTAISTFSVPGEWAHVVATYDGTTMRLYLDGEECASAVSSVNVSQPNAAVSIGAMDFDWGVTDYFGFFYGRIDEPAVYDRALSVDEIQAHYAAGAVTDPSLTLSPPSPDSFLFTGQEVSFTATIEGVSDASGAELTATVTGANPQTISAIVEGTSATFSYNGTNAGSDSVEVSGVIDGLEVSSVLVEIDWLAGSSSVQNSFGLPGTSLYAASAVETWADPVNSSTGNFYQSATDVSIPGTGAPFSLERTYNSRDKKVGPFGKGWSGGVFASLSTDDAGNATLRAGDGQEIGFLLQSDGSYEADSNVTAKLTKTDSGFDLVLYNQETQHFNSDGCLVSRLDQNGQGLHFADDGDGRLTSVTDSGGRDIGFAYDSQGHLTQVTLPGGTMLSYGYDGDLLSSFTDQTGAVTTYAYNGNGYLTSVTDPTGRLAFENTYDEQGRVLTQKDVLGYESTFDWAVGQAVATDAANSEWTDTYNDSGQLSTRTDALGNTSEYEYDEANNLLSLTDPLGNKTTMTYDERGNMLTKRDALGQIESWTYDSNNDALSHTDQLEHVTSYTYDSSGNLLTETGPLHKITSYGYDSEGRLVSETDPLTRVTKNSYDDQSNLIEKISPSGAKTTYTYDELGRELSETDPLGHTTTSEYDDAGRLVKTTDPRGHSTTSTYDDGGRLTAKTDARGYTTRYEYDQNGRQVAVINPDGSSTYSEYDALDSLVASTDALGNVTRYEHDALGRRTATISPTNKRTETTYDANGNAVSSTDPLDKITTTRYDKLGREVESTDALNRTAKTEYDAVGNVVKKTDPRGGESITEYDGDGRVVKEIDPLAHFTTFGYDDAGQLISETDANGYTTYHDYDLDGREISVTSPSGAITKSEYDAAGNLLSTTDPLNHVTIYSYDATGNQISETNPLGAHSIREYDKNGNQISETDLLGHTSTTVFDDMNREVEQIDALGRTTKTDYDAAGNVVKTTDALGNVTKSEYDAEGRLAKTIDPLGHETVSDYDDAGRLSSETDANGHTTSNAYDAVGQKISVTAPDGSVTSYDYDASGNVVKRTDANDHATTYSYDAAGNKTTKASALGNSWHYAYDKNGNLIETRTPSGGTISQAYDSENRLAEKSYSDGTPTVYYAYDLAGNKLSQIDGIGTTRYSYDAADQRVSALSRDGGFLYSYDPNGNLTSRTYPNGLKTSCSYNDAGELIAASVKGKVTRYSHDPNGNLTSTLYANGILDTRSYDKAGRLTEIKGADSRGSVLYSRSYTYDAVGNPLTLEATVPRERSRGWWGKARLHNRSPLTKWTETYSYDSRDRLTKACMNESCSRYDAYSYDPVGNRTRLETRRSVTNYAYDSADELLSASKQMRGHHHKTPTLYSYDLNGNETAEGSTRYAYNLENKLVQVVDRGKKISYAYTGDGLMKTRSTRSETTTYAWDTSSDPAQLALETTREGLGWLAFSDTVTYTDGEGAIGMETQRDSYSYHTDALGSVIELSDGKGKITESYRYSPYGEDYATGYSGDAKADSPNPIRFTGQYLDSESDLYNMRAREYEPGTGRFLEVDPLECDSGGACGSTYAYVEDQPTVMVDPSGEGAMMTSSTSANGGSGLDAPPTYKEGNGCGPSGWLGRLVPDSIEGRCDFTGPCNNHDYCYGWVWGNVRKQCDRRFLNNMNGWCNDNIQPTRWDWVTGKWILKKLRHEECHAIARIYYQAVRGVRSSVTVPIPIPEIGPEGPIIAKLTIHIPASKLGRKTFIKNQLNICPFKKNRKQDTARCMRAIKAKAA